MHRVHIHPSLGVSKNALFNLFSSPPPGRPRSPPPPPIAYRPAIGTSKRTGQQGYRKTKRVRVSNRPASDITRASSCYLEVRTLLERSQISSIVDFRAVPIPFPDSECALLSPLLCPRPLSLSHPTAATIINDLGGGAVRRPQHDEGEEEGIDHYQIDDWSPAVTRSSLPGLGWLHVYEHSVGRAADTRTARQQASFFTRSSVRPSVRPSVCPSVGRTLLLPFLFPLKVGRRPSALAVEID